MRTLTVLLAAAVVATALARDDAAEKEKKKLNGTWVLASGRVDGKAVPEEHVKATKITWDGDKATVVSPHQSKDPITAKRTRLDPGKKPAEMDWVRDAGPQKGKTMLAIYEWVDDDTYRICFDPACKERPKDFEAAAGSGHIVHVWKRAKK
jgi:uncharacterized protein (TIGR03067 family)